MGEGQTLVAEVQQTQWPWFQQPRCHTVGYNHPYVQQQQLPEPSWEYAQTKQQISTYAILSIYETKSDSIKTINYLAIYYDKQMFRKSIKPMDATLLFLCNNYLAVLSMLKSAKFLSQFL